MLDPNLCKTKLRVLTDFDMETVPLKVTTTRLKNHFKGATADSVQGARRIYRLFLHIYRRLQSVKMLGRRPIYCSALFYFITLFRNKVKK
jgi:hypothetical protein